MKRLLCHVLIVAVLGTLPALAAARPAPYQTRGQCDGYPAISLKTQAGLCVGLVTYGLKMPRGIIALADGTLLVTEMGSWEAKRGRVLRLTPKPGGNATSRVLFDQLDRPHGLRLGPDGKVYVAEAGSLFRFDPHAAKPERESLLSGWPDSGTHPLKGLAFDTDGALYVSLGAASDRCEDAQGNEPNPARPCAETQQSPSRASVLRYSREWLNDAAQRQTRRGDVFATGLRNSLALAVHPASKRVYGADNGFDALPNPNLPHDELNWLRAGLNYGWPYCYDQRRPTPQYPRYDCSKTEPPLRLLPAHAAPLGMLFMPDNAGPAMLRGALVITYHGYRQHGHRLGYIPFNAAGEPTGPARDLVYGWDRGPGRQLGTPVDITLGGDGALYVTEDRNGTVLRIAQRPAR